MWIVKKISITHNGKQGSIRNVIKWPTVALFFAKYMVKIPNAAAGVGENHEFLVTNCLGLCKMKNWSHTSTTSRW